MPKPMKRVQLVIAAIAVICPHCRQPIGAPDTGSDMWAPDEIEAKRGKGGECGSCGGPFYLPHKVATVRMP